MNERPLCKRCGLKPRESKGNNEWRPLCWKCRRPILTANRKYRKNAVAKSKINVEDFKCAICGFIPVLLPK